MPDNLTQDFHDVYEICQAGWTNFLSEAKLNMDYYLDNQYTEKEQSKAKRQDRDLYVINKMKRQINLLHGYEIRNRHILKIGPTESEDDLPSRQHTGVIMHLMSRGNITGYDVLSQAFKWGPLISGSNLMEIYKDRQGDLQYSRHGFNGFLLDPSFTKRDLSDCDNIPLGQWVSKDMVKMLLPEGADKIDSIEPLKTSNRWGYLGAPVLANKANKRLYEQWWRRKIEYTETVVHRMTGQEMAFDDYVKDYTNGDAQLAQRLIAELKMPNGMPVLTKYSKPTPWIRLTIFVDDQMVWDGKNPLLTDDYPFVWLNGDFAPEYTEEQLKLQGFALSLRDPQKARNKRVCQAIDIIESVIQTGRVMRDKYIKNTDDTYKSGQGIPIHIDDDAPDEMPIDEIFKQISAHYDLNGILGVMEVLDKDLTEAGGLNEEIFGSDDKDIPGILHRYRTGAALTGQQGIFSGYRAAKRELGRKLVNVVQLNYDENKVHRIINEWPAPGFYEPDFTRYDCTPTEGLMTDSQQHLFYLELKYLRQTFPDFEQIIAPSVLVQAMPIQFKRELLEMIKQAEQQAKQQQQAGMEDKQRMDRLIEAQTAERIAEAEEDRANAMWDRTRTAAELQKMESDKRLAVFDRLLKLEELQLKRMAEVGRQKQIKARPKKKAKAK